MNVLNAILWTFVWFFMCGLDNYIRLLAGKEEKEYSSDAHGAVGIIWLIGINVCLWLTR